MKKSPGILTAALATLAAAAALNAAAPKRPNVLFIVSDDLRPELGCYGASHMHTPNIDRLAKTGTLFERPYVQQAVCAATRASFLTGCRPDTTGVDYPYTKYFVDTFLKEKPSIMRAFMEQGYHVRTFGKVHHGLIEPLSEPHFKPGAGYYVMAETIKRTGGKKGDAAKGRAPVAELGDKPDNAYQDGQIADAVVETLGRVARLDEPFFLAVGFQKPHLPWVAPKQYADLYDLDTVPLSPNPRPNAGVPEYATSHHAITKFAGYPSDDVTVTQQRELRRDYFACVSFVDAQVGRVLDALEKSGAAANTIVVFIGDHGWHLQDQGMWGKTTNYEHSTWSPLIVRAPGFAAAQRSKALVEYVDLFPSLLDLCGLAQPDYLEGTSFKPLLAKPDAPWKTAAFSQFPRRNTVEGYAIRTDRYRYVEWRDKKNGAVTACELYDHQTDSDEATNLADQPGRAALLAEMARQLHAGWKAALPAGVVNRSNNPPAPPSEKLRDSENEPD